MDTRGENGDGKTMKGGLGGLVDGRKTVVRMMVVSGGRAVRLTMR